MSRLHSVAVMLATFGLVLIVSSIRMRRSRGLARGSTVALDNKTLFSTRLRLVGRPDRIVRRGKAIIPEEWKSARRSEPWHAYQLGSYFLLIEDEYGVRPPYGFLVLGNGKRHRIENTPELRQAVIETAMKIREARRATDRELPGVLQERKCRACGVRSVCGQVEDLDFRAKNPRRTTG